MREEWKRRLFRRILTGLLAFIFFTSCDNTRQILVVQDRQAGYFIPILQSEKDTSTLILLDYHHNIDTGPNQSGPSVDSDMVNSSNWLGELILEDRISQVYWVSGNDLSPREIQLQQNRLEEVLQNDSPLIAQEKSSMVNILSWEDLLLQERGGYLESPLIVSLDLDILAMDSSEDSDAFLESILNFIQRQNPELTTLALSAAYQQDSVDAWRWLIQSYRNLSQGATVYWMAGDLDYKAVNQNEQQAWQEWEAKVPAIDFGASFAPGSRLWNRAPYQFWIALKENPPLGFDNDAQRLRQILDRSMAEWEQLDQEFPMEFRRELCKKATEILLQHLETQTIPEKEPVVFPGNTPRGLAIRFVQDRQDRGCIAFYQGIENWNQAAQISALSAALFDPRYDNITLQELSFLDIEIAIFGEFFPMIDPLDFVPGMDSIIMEYQGQRTLLQATLAEQRNLSKSQFLDTLCRKAGYEQDFWKKEDLLFFRASTVSLRMPLPIEN